MAQKTDFPLNPYIWSEPIVNERLFINRTWELSKIDGFLERLLAHDKTLLSLFLIGPRKRGKTTLLQTTMRRLAEKGIPYAYVTLTRDHAFLSPYELVGDVFLKQTMIQFGIWKRYLYKIWDTLRRVKKAGGGFSGSGGEIEVEAKQKLLDDFSPRFRHVAKKIGGKGYPVVIFLDEIQYYQDNQPQSVPILLSFLRTLIEVERSFIFVMAGTSDFINSEPIASNFQRLPVGPYDQDEDAEEAVEKPLEVYNEVNGTKIKFDSVSKKVIIESVKSVTDEVDKSDGYNPFLINYLCHHAFDDCIKKKKKTVVLTRENALHAASNLQIEEYRIALIKKLSESMP